MDEVKFKLELDRIEADPNQYEVVTEFDGAVRNVDIMTFEKGDVINLPATINDCKIVKQHIGDNVTQFVLVGFERGGVDMGVNRFYPSSLTKTAFPCDSTGRLLDSSKRVTASGTAADEYRKHGSVQEAMIALLGKKLVISEARRVPVPGNRPGQIRNTYVYTIDIVEEKAA